MKTNRIPHIIQKRATIPVLAGLAMLLTTGLPVFAGDPGPQSQVVPPDPVTDFYGDLLAKWWQWSFSFPVSADPEAGTADFSAGQSGNIWFFPGPLGGGTVTRTGTIPAGTALFVPVFTFEADNTGCPTYTDYTVAQLTAELQGGWSAVTATSCTIDGVAVAGMENPADSAYLTLTQPFSYTLAPYDNVLANYPGFIGESCIPDGTTVSPTLAEGICILIRPLSVGKHTIHIGASVPAYGITYDVTYNITVAPR